MWKWSVSVDYDIVPIYLISNQHTRMKIHTLLHIFIYIYMTDVPEHRCICNNGDIFALVIRDSLDARSGQVWPPLCSVHAFACPPA